MILKDVLKSIRLNRINSLEFHLMMKLSQREKMLLFMKLLKNVHWKN